VLGQRADNRDSQDVTSACLRAHHIGRKKRPADQSHFVPLEHGLDDRIALVNVVH
jgi:hypothetical protein